MKGNALGMGMGQTTFVSSGLELPATDGNYAWEWWYRFQITDHISVTPAFYYLSRPYGALSGKNPLLTIIRLIILQDLSKLVSGFDKELIY